MNHRALRVAALFAAFLFQSASARPITETDLFQFKWIGDPQITRDGLQVAYVQVVVDEKKEGYETQIWSVPTSGGAARPLTFAKGDSSPRWSPDGTQLAFLRSVEKDGKPQPPQLWLLPMGGGEAHQITRLPKGVSSPRWSNDGKQLAFLSTSNARDLAQAQCEAQPEADKKKCAGPRVSDVQVITRAVYRSNGSGYMDFSRSSHIWSIGVQEGAQAKQLTQGQFDERDIVWSADDQRIYYTSNRNHEAYFDVPSTTIYAVPAAGGEVASVASFAGRASGLALNPQGTQLAFFGYLGRPVQSHVNTHLWTLNLAKPGSAPRDLSSGKDWDIGSSVITDMNAPRAGGEVLPVWSEDGQSLTVVVAKQGRANLERFDVHGAAKSVTEGDQAVLRYVGAGARMVALISTTTEANELYLLGAGAPQRLTNVNQKLAAELTLDPPQDLWYKSFDKQPVHALVQYPPGFDPKKQYPLILNIHGGPHAAYGHSFFHEMQWMAAKGYIVLYPNPRGSTSYGEQFANVIQYRYPGDDYKDLMAGVDELIKRGYVDSKRMGVTGGSGGGLLTNWIIGHTDRFAAAVSQRDISNWADWWYSADISFFNGEWFRKAPFEDPEAYRAISPITYVNKVVTPTMFVLGDADSRTPAEAGGDQMFRALKYRKVPTAMVRFPNASHELSRSGNPWHRVERLQHIMGWFDLYLMGKQTTAYDLAH